MKIKFMPMNIEVDVDSKKSLLQIATENNIKIKSICNGVTDTMFRSTALKSVPSPAS